MALEGSIENRLKGSGIEERLKDNCAHQGSKVQMSINLQPSASVDPNICIHPTYLLTGSLGKVCQSSFLS